MPNRFVGPWNSFRTPTSPPGPTVGEGILDMSEIGSQVQVGVRHRTVLDQTNANNTDVPNPRIEFTRTLRDGTTIHYDGQMIVEIPIPRKSHISGTYTLRRPGSRALLANETGDWTANRPPPRPRRGATDGEPAKKPGSKRPSAKTKDKGKQTAATKKAYVGKSTAGKKTGATTKSSAGRKAAGAKKAAATKKTASKARKGKTR